MRKEVPKKFLQFLNQKWGNLPCFIKSMSQNLHTTRTRNKIHKRNKIQIQKRAHNDARRKEVQTVSAPLNGAMNLHDRNIQEYYSMLAGQTRHVLELAN